MMLLSGCATPPPSKPAPPPPVAAVPPPPPRSADWRDTPLAPGAWRYVPGGAMSSARYGREGMPADLILRCDKGTRQIALLRQGVATEFSITTSAGVERRPAGRIDEAGGAMTGIVFNAGDPLLDRILFSRGRFAVAAPELPMLVVPAWAEPARAVEDCRK